MVHTPWDSLFVLLSLWSNYKKSWKQSPAPSSNFPAPKEQFIHIARPPTPTPRQRFVNWTTLFPTCCSRNDFSSTLSLPCNKYCQPKGTLGLILNDFPRQLHILSAKTHLWAVFYMYCSLNSTLDHISSVYCKMKLMWEPLTNLQEMLQNLLQLYSDTVLIRYLVNFPA